MFLNKNPIQVFYYKQEYIYHLLITNHIPKITNYETECFLSKKNICSKDCENIIIICENRLKNSVLTAKKYNKITKGFINFPSIRILKNIYKNYINNRLISFGFFNKENTKFFTIPQYCISLIETLKKQEISNFNKMRNEEFFRRNSIHK